MSQKEEKISPLLWGLDPLKVCLSDLILTIQTSKQNTHNSLLGWAGVWPKLYLNFIKSTWLLVLIGLDLSNNHY